MARGGERDQLEGRNPVLECLDRARRAVHRVWLDQGAGEDPRIHRVLEMCAVRSIEVVRVDRHFLDRKAQGRVHNGIIAEADPIALWSVQRLVEHHFEERIDPFLVLADGLSYEHNLGAVMRTGLGFGVTGLVLPTRRGAALSPVVQRVAMGAAEEVRVAREGLFSALKTIRQGGIRVVGADMAGAPLQRCDLRGALALVLGEEGRGLTAKLRERCDEVVSIPLAGRLESLNVSVAAGIIMYEKRRQDGWFGAG